MPIGATGYLLWRDESTYGTDPGTGSKTADAASVELNWNRNLERVKALWGVRNVPKVYSQEKHVEGRIALNTSDWKMLKHVLGSLTENVTSATQAPYYHDFEEAETLPSFTLERQWGSNTAYVAVGCKVNSARIRGEVGKAVEFELEILGKSMSKITSGLAIPSYSPTLPFRMTNLATATFGGSDVSGQIKSFEININNNLEPDYGSDGTPRAIDEGLREVTGTLTFKFDYTIADYVLNESEGDIVIKLIRGTNDEVEFTIENATFEALNDVTEAEAQKELELAFMSQADPTNKNCIKVRVTSANATYY
ncbi:phage tail tube protein [Geoglobus acetivorans]|uniref:Major tail protein n=1 Tax=Geoglobus acetivorans TaxID=565033 RepID=A0ABZ3H512_GEOAI|nr:hypothetical protein [Geoglobus acetivorans]